MKVLFRDFLLCSAATTSRFKHQQYVTYGQNIQMHKTFIRIGIRKTWNTDDFLGSGMKLLLPSLRLGFRHEERERHNFSMLTVRPSSALNWLTQPSRACTPLFITGLALPKSKNQLASSKSKSQLTAFIQNPQESQPIGSGHDVIHTPESFSIWSFYCDIYNCHILPARAWTPALSVCT